MSPNAQDQLEGLDFIAKMSASNELGSDVKAIQDILDEQEAIRAQLERVERDLQILAA